MIIYAPENDMPSLFKRLFDAPWSPRKLQREWKRLRNLGSSWTAAEASMRERGLFPEPIEIRGMFQLGCDAPGFNAAVQP